MSISDLATSEWVIILIGTALVPFAVFGGLYLGELLGNIVYGVPARPNMSVRMSHIYDSVEDLYDQVDEESAVNTRPPMEVPIYELPYDTLSHSSSDVSHQYFGRVNHPFDSDTDEHYNDAFSALPSTFAVQAEVYENVEDYYTDAFTPINPGSEQENYYTDAISARNEHETAKGESEDADDHYTDAISTRHVQETTL